MDKLNRFWFLMTSFSFFAVVHFLGQSDYRVLIAMAFFFFCFSETIREWKNRS